MNKKIIKLIKRDLIVGFSKNRYKFLFTILIFFALSFVNLINIKNSLVSNESINHSVRFIDLLFEMFKGAGYKNSEIPINWIIINIYISFLIGNYYYDDISQESSHMLVRMEKRKDIWISKVVWMVSTVIVFYLLLLAIIIIIAYINGDMSFNISNIKRRYGGIGNLMNGNLLIISTVFIYISTSICISIIQMLLSCIIKPSYMYLSIIFTIAISFMLKTYMLPIQSSLMLRQQIFDSTSKMNITNSLIYNFIIFVVIFIIGIVFIRKFDILKSQMTD